MNPSRRLRISVVAACVASLAIAVPGDASAAKRKKRAHKAAAVVEVIPHKYLAGGDGATDLTLPARTPVALVDLNGVVQALGDQALGTLGSLPTGVLPPLPAVPTP